MQFTSLSVSSAYNRIFASKILLDGWVDKDSLCLNVSRLGNLCNQSGLTSEYSDSRMYANKFFAKSACMLKAVSERPGEKED